MLFAKNDLVALSHAFATEVGLTGKPAVELLFGQPWMDQAQEAFRSGYVALYPQKKGLAIIASFNDEVIYSKATTMNQPMWQLGDVFEIFVGIPGQPEYWELHVTPSNRRLQLVWTEQTFNSFNKKDSELLDHTIPDTNFLTSSTRINQEKGYWQVYAFLPWGSIGLLDDGDSYPLELAFCRYDSSSSHQPPVLSSTAQFDRRNFHMRDHWNKITLKVNADHTDESQVKTTTKQ